MLLYTCYDPADMLTAYILGGLSGVIIVFLGGWICDKVDEYKEFKAFKNRPHIKNGPPVVDAEFVDRSTRPAQLNSSQALVLRSTSQTTNQQKRIDRR